MNGLKKMDDGLFIYYQRHPAQYGFPAYTARYGIDEWGDRWRWNDRINMWVATFYRSKRPF